VWIVRLPQNNQRQLSPKAVQSHDRDVSNEEYDERAKSQEMQTSRALPSVKEFDIPRETSGKGRASLASDKIAESSMKRTLRGGWC